MVAGILKARDRHAFETALANFPLLRGASRPTLASTWPWIEVVGAAAAFVSVSVAATMALVIAYATMFAVLGHAWFTGARGSCGCLGREIRMLIGGRSVLQVLMLMTLAVLLLLLRSRPAEVFIDDALARATGLALATAAVLFWLRVRVRAGAALPDPRE
jgi:hypothetical protein